MASDPPAPGIGDHLLLGFDGLDLPPDVADALAVGIGRGVTLFRYANVRSAGQVRRLTDDVRAAAGRPVLVCADQEGGQFLALGDDTTPFAGNLALGAADDLDLTERVAAALGTEVRACGVDVDYAPVCDLLTTPANPGLGIRTFGDDPVRVGAHAAAFVHGLQSVGAVACVKHFPGKGDAGVDSHHDLPVIQHDRHHLDDVELVPFRAAIAAGAGMAMSSHAAYPRITGDATLPGTLSEEILTGLLRHDLGFGGVVVTDALDMKALSQGATQIVDAVAALGAGADLLLLTAEAGMRRRIVDGLGLAVRRRLLARGHLDASAARIQRLAASIPAERPDPDVVGRQPHRRLAAELAHRAVTLVRDGRHLLPLAASSRLLAVMPAPFDRTPADTSSAVRAGLAGSLAARFDSVDELVVQAEPDRGQVEAAVARATASDVVVVGTIDAHAHPSQVALVEALVATGRPVVSLSLRVPTDAALVPESTTHLATYGILPPSLDAVADVLVGHADAPGRLPLAVGPYPRGHRLEQAR